jgi:uncharacterized protein YndB with AHSA1/START domain
MNRNDVMTTFSTTIDIAAPRERVWDVLSDVERWHEWTASVTRIRRLGTGPLAPGARAIVRLPKFPPALWKVVAIEPGRAFTWVSGAPGLWVWAHHSVDDGPHGARATLSLRLTGILGGLFGRLTRQITERYLALEANGLKSRSEDPAFRHSGVAI